MVAYYNDKKRTAFLIYLVTNKMNGRQYIGITVSGLRRRWLEHLRNARNGAKTALHAAIRKYGVGSFDIQELASALSREYMKALEIELIVEFGTFAPNGYNLTAGGDGANGLAREVVERVASMNRGRKHTDEAKQRISEAGKGRIASKEKREAISKAHRGKTLSPEHRAKLSFIKTGKKLPPRSLEHSAKIADGLRAAHARRKRI